MASPETPTAETFESEAPELLDAIARARKRVEGTAGLVDGTLDRFRERIDRLLRESEVDNWRQVRIFNRDVDALAADLGKAAKEKRLSPRLDAAPTAAYLDFLSRSRADQAIPLLLEASQGTGIGVPAPPPGCDPEPLLRLLNNASPQGEVFRTRSFYGLLELPGYSDAKLTHVFGDARLIRGSLDAAWAWLKAIRDDERRSLQIQWSEDVTMLKRRTPSIVGFVERLGKLNDAAERGRELVAALLDGRFDAWQSAARLYATHGDAAVRKWRGILEKDIEAMGEEGTKLAAVLKRFPDPGKVESGSARGTSLAPA